jgi:polyhydroxyalkanoate synthesis repressor PhaR
MSPRRKPAPGPSQTQKIIKRYGNRKLYDTQLSRYVTLEEISQMVRRGEDLKVIDNRTKEDLTALTLTQIMLEEEKKKKNILPLSLLQNLIQHGGGSIAELVQRGKDSLASMRTEAEEQLLKLLEKGQDAVEEGPALLKDLLFGQQKALGLDVLQKRIDERIKLIVQRLTGLEDLEKQIQELEQRLDRMEAALKGTSK